MASVLIAGADESLGLETARRLVRAGHTVWLGSRELSLSRMADVGARTVQLDVTSDESVAAAAAEVESLDVLVNNAGTAPERETFEGSLFEIVRVLQAFLPLLERSASPVVLNVSSPSAPLAAAAVNVVTLEYAKAFPHMRINAVEQGAEITW